MQEKRKLYKNAGIEGNKGKLPLSLGIRDSNMDIIVKVDTKEKQEKISLQFAP